MTKGICVWPDEGAQLEPQLIVGSSAVLISVSLRRRRQTPLLQVIRRSTANLRCLMPSSDG